MFSIKEGKKEVMHLKESKEWHMEGFAGRKGVEEMMWLNYNHKILFKIFLKQISLKYTTCLKGERL